MKSEERLTVQTLLASVSILKKGERDLRRLAATQSS